jgi:hypothetical protein
VGSLLHKIINKQIIGAPKSQKLLLLKDGMTSHELFIEKLAEIFGGLTVNIKVSWPQIAKTWQILTIVKNWGQL